MARKNISYTASFKLQVVRDLCESNVRYSDVVRKYWDCDDRKIASYVNRLKLWKTLYLEYGEEGLCLERRGKATKQECPLKGRPSKNNVAVIV